MIVASVLAELRTAADLMKCPHCNGDLKPGFLAIHGTEWGFLLNVWGNSNAIFRQATRAAVKKRWSFPGLNLGRPLSVPGARR
jgi:hypothetical protein